MCYCRPKKSWAGSRTPCTAAPPSAPSLAGARRGLKMPWRTTSQVATPPSPFKTPRGSTRDQGS
eukprot:2999573-Rhodomonas_salina.1